MKVISLFITFTFYSPLFAAPAKYSLNCWNAYFAKARVPYMSAVIEDHNVLSNVRFYYRNNSGIIPKAPPGKIKGQMITSNRSPYKGMNDFHISTAIYGLERLILPTDLSNENLQNISKSIRNRENGVIIGSWEGDGAGSHFSVRLICTSNM